MIIIVDAYNLLHAIPKYSHSNKLTDHERNHFIMQLARYGRVKGHVMVAVFDGGPFSSNFKQKINDVVVIYSGKKESADDSIKDYIAAHKSQELLLVSSDSELRKYALDLGVEALQSDYFYALMQHALHKKKQSRKKTTHDIVKITLQENPEIDALMAQTTTVPMKNENTSRSGTSKKNKASKKERKLLKKVKKL